MQKAGKAFCILFYCETKNMPSYCLKIPAKKEKAEQLVDYIFEHELLETQAASVMEDPETKDWFAEIYFQDKPNIDDIKTQVSPLNLQEELDESVMIELDDIDWVRHALEGLSPVEVGPYFVCGGHDVHKAKPDQIIIQIEASHAFGTGHHSTTEGCLSLMNDVFDERDIKTMLDVGCGSAVLSIGAAKHIKPQIIATEIDPQSAHIAKENTALNGVSELVHIETRGDLINIGHPQGIKQFDLVVANILANPLIELSQQICNATKPSGYIILSGLLAEQEEEVSKAYNAHGFEVVKRFQKGEWIALGLANLK